MAIHAGLHESCVHLVSFVRVVQVGEGGASLLGPLHLLVSAFVLSLCPQGRFTPRLRRLGQACQLGWSLTLSCRRSLLIPEVTRELG